MHIVLHQPEIPQNTGNVGRTCVAVGAKLWLVRPLGFRLDEKHLRRAGMDYWRHLSYEVVDDWPTLLRKLDGVRLWMVEGGEPGEGRAAWDAELGSEDAYVFGSEGQGLPQSILGEHAGRRIWLPMRADVRSLNLASTVNTIAYEVVRQSQPDAAAGSSAGPRGGVAG